MGLWGIDWLHQYRPARVRSLFQLHISTKACHPCVSELDMRIGCMCHNYTACDEKDNDASVYRSSVDVSTSSSPSDPQNSTVPSWRVLVRDRRCRQGSGDATDVEFVRKRDGVRFSGSMVSMRAMSAW